jgi:hypothetical protein
MGADMLEAARYVFEIHDEEAGVLIREPQGYVFCAAALWAWPLDGSCYDSVKEAERAIHAVAREHDLT